MDPFPSARRSEFEIMADILRLGEANLGDIILGSNLSWYLSNKYLPLLAKRGFLTITTKGRQKIYHTTKEGETLVHRIDDVYRRLGKKRAEENSTVASYR
ncbi:hypothetical protein ES707_00163 [subsurface metagenome]